MYGCNIAQLALPNHTDVPPHVGQHGKVSQISFLVAAQLLIPECFIGFRPCPSWAIMSMPKAPMDEHNLSTARKHQIRFSREVGTMQPVTVAQRKQQSAYGYFRLRVFATHLSHNGMSGLTWPGIHHSQALTQTNCRHSQSLSLSNMDCRRAPPVERKIFGTFSANLTKITVAAFALLRPHRKVLRQDA